ncbi:MAG: type II secretion system F family protein [Gemmatimonadales bacterium]|nr:type II secretion system F family protein [Gemmatimonadales bacterium]
MSTALPTHSVIRPLSSSELAVGLRILADLAAAGLPLTRALRVFGDVAPPGWRAATPDLVQSVREGKGLARALEESGLSVPAVALGLVRAGETGGGLTTSLERAAEYAETTESTRAAVRGALAYPAVVGVVGTGTIVIMVGVVLPRFAAVLADLKQSLPPTTLAVLSVAEWMRQWGPLLLAVAALAGILLRAMPLHSGGRRALHRLLLTLPGIGAIRWSNATARFTATLAALLECGLALRAALRHAAEAIGDDEIRARLAEARARLDAGETLGHVLRESAVLTPLAVSLVSAGEASGRLPAMLSYASRLELRRADHLTRVGVRWIEPSLILLFALVVGLVATAMLQAVYAVRPA